MLMESLKHCPDCGTDWSGGQTCADNFHLLSAWELDYQRYDVHHLMVLCYHLQHPHLYSTEGLRDAKRLLSTFLIEGLTPQQVRRSVRNAVDSGHRSYKITATPTSIGSYDRPFRWSMTVSDVAAAGLEHYYPAVRAWADSVLSVLRESNNLA